MLALAWISRVDDGGALNVLVPAFAPLACWFGLGVGEAQQGDARYRAGALALLAVALVVVRYNPRDGSPLRSDVWAGERLVATIGQLPGSVYSPVYAEYAYQAGKGDAAYATNVMELMGSFGGGVRPYGEDWMAQYTEALRERRFDQLLLDPEYAGFLVQGAQDSGYVDTGQLFPVDDVITQWQSPFIQMPHRWVPRERLTP